MTMRHYLQTLGATSLCDSESVFAITAREAALLTYISKARTPVSRKSIIDLFWPEATPQKAKHSLSQILYSIRNRYPTLSLTVAGDAVAALNLDVDVIEIEKDAAAERNLKAVMRYRGRFLSGDDLGSFALRQWRDDIEDITACIIGELLTELSYSCSAAELGTVIDTAELVLSVHPHLASVQAALLEATARSGLTAKAIKLHNIFSTSEQYEGTGLPPIESFIGGLRAPRSKHVAPFTGRKHELQTLEAAWSTAARGEGQVVIVAGEPGIGKSRLADYFLRRIAIRGGSVWVASCCAATQRLPYSAVHELVRSNAPHLEQQLFGAPIEEATNQLSTSDHFRHRLTELLTTAIVDRSSSMPLAILVDDAQWSDEYTALLLSYWSYRVRSERILIILTVRTQEADPTPDWLASDLGRTVRIELGRLSIAAAKEIVDAFERINNVDLSQPVRDAVLWQSGGRPFLLMETLDSVSMGERDQDAHATALTEPAEALLSRRFKNLPAEAEHVAGLLSVWGQPISSLKLQSLSCLSDHHYSAALNVLHQRGIVQLERGQVACPHDLMRETAYRALMPGSRLLYHRQIATAIAADSGPHGLAAQHYAQAGDNIAAGKYAQLAAEEAWNNHAYSDFEYYCKLGVQSSEGEQRTAIAALLVRYLIQCGRGEQAEEYLHLLDDQAGDYAVLKTISILERDLSRGEQSASDLLYLAKAIMSDAAVLDDPASAAAATAILCVAFDASASDEEYRSLFEEIATARNMPIDTQLQLDAVLAIWQGVARSAADGLSIANAAVERVSENTSMTASAACRYAQGTLLLLTGRVEQADACFRSALELAQRAGDIRREQSIYINHGVALLELNHIASARESFERVLTSSNLHFRMRCYTNLAMLHFENGEYSLARQAAEAVQTMNQSYQSPLLETLCRAIIGLVAITENDLSSARACQRHIEAGPWSSIDDASYTAIFLARMLRLDGRYDDSLNLLIATIDRTQHRDVLCTLRLQCEAASLLTKDNPDVAYIMLKAVLTQAASGGAKRLYERAAELMLEVTH